MKCKYCGTKCQDDVYGFEGQSGFRHDIQRCRNILAAQLAAEQVSHEETRNALTVLNNLYSHAVKVLVAHGLEEE